MQENVNIPDSTITSALTFRNLVLMNMQQLTNFPYIEKDFDALTDYELLCLVVKFLNDVIANQNEQNDSITNMYNAFLALQTYVNNTKDTLEDAFNNLDDYVRNYFDNLDVQEEINNKLDQMLEDGVLEEIIESFLQTNALWCFDNVAAMKLATNFINGSTAKTLGYYAANDGGKSLYKIRTKTNDDIADEMFLIDVYDSNLIAELITEPETNIRQLGANETENDNSSFINASLNKLNYAYIPIGTFNCSSQITLHSNQTLFGLDKIKSKLVYTGNQKFIVSEDLATTQYITIHDLTINGTDSNGYGLYFERTTKQGDVWHRLYNLYVREFEYGIYLSKHLNEIQLSDITAGANQYGIYLTHVDDFYVERCVCAVNTKHGFYMTDTTEGRISDSKFWYNGSDNASTYTNLYMTSCTAINCVNITCQESYGNNLRLTYSKNISMLNTYLSRPGLDGNEHFQISMEHLVDSKLDCITANRKVDGNYTTKIITCLSENLGNKFNIMIEDDFPDNMKVTVGGSNNNYAFNLKNDINFYGDNLNIYKNLNYLINGDIANTTNINDMITAGRDYCSYSNGHLRIANNTDSTQTITFNHPTIPRTGLYTFYMKFRKVSGTGRVVMYYSGYYDVTADTSTSEDLYVSYAGNKTSTAAATNINFTIAAGLTIDVYEVGMCEGFTCNINNPMYSKSILS